MNNPMLALRGFLVSWVKSFQCMTRLRRDFGHARSTKTRFPVDCKGAPLPWYTYPAIEYLSQLDLRDKTVFEFGSGNSSLFWAARAKQVVSIENDPAWHTEVSKRKPANLDLRLVQNKEDYMGSLRGEPTSFDIVVVDGSHRAACAAEAVLRLKPGGIIVLDNSDWFQKASAALRQSGLIQVDMKGFGPINGYAWCTTLFFHREFHTPTLSPITPTPGWGSISQAVDE